MRDYARRPPIIAPTKRGPMCARESTKPPAPANAPISGSPVRLVERTNKRAPMTSPGTKTARMADPTPPDFFPPTTPAMQGPTTGNQNKRTEIRNIHTTPRATLPCVFAAGSETISAIPFQHVHALRWGVRTGDALQNQELLSPEPRSVERRLALFRARVNQSVVGFRDGFSGRGAC